MKILNTKSTSASFMCKYNEGKREAGTAQLLLSSICAERAQDLEVAMNHFAFACKTKNLKNRFSHLKVSLSPEDQNISNDTFEEIGKRVLQELGYSKNPFAMYRHLDTAHPHIHIVLSRVGFDGTLVRDSFDGLKAKRIERLLEKEFELTPSFDKLLTKAGVRLPGYAERWQMKEEHTIRKDLQKKGLKGMPLEVRVAELKKQSVNSMKRFVQNAVLECMYDHPGGDVFVKRLARRGISMVRHEFTRDNKKHFGISYHYDPDNERASFKSKTLPGQVAGDEVKQVAFNAEYFDHAYFNEIPVYAKVTQKGMPQLCLFDAAPVEPEKKVSFRALNLGPAFMEDSLRKTMSFSQELLRSITIKRKKKAEVSYPNTARIVLAKEEEAISRVMVAAEIRSPERVLEAAQALPLNKLRNKLSGIGTQTDFNFVFDALLKKQSSVKSISNTPLKPDGKELENRQPVNPLIEKYQHQFGISPSAMTSLALTYLQQGYWKELNSLLLAQMTIPENKAKGFDLVDDRVLQYVPLGKEVRSTAYNFGKWRYEIQSEYTYHSDKEKEKIVQDTTALIDALKKGDQASISYILQHLSPDFKQVPAELIGNVSDENLTEELRAHFNIASKRPGLLDLKGISPVTGKKPRQADELDDEMGKDAGQKIE